METLDWILMAFAGFCIAVIGFLIWLGRSPELDQVPKRRKFHWRSGWLRWSIYVGAFF